MIIENNKFPAKYNKAGKLYEKTLGRLIPIYGVISLICCFLLNSLIYSGTQWLMSGAKHYDLTTSWDRMIPFRKEWILIYLVCFGFWAINYILIVREGEDHWFRFAAADMISRLICGAFFVILPTTNIRPEVTGSDLCSNLMRFMYSMDAPTNLFPSIHCLVSWFCFVGIRKSQKLPLWYKWFSAVFALLVCASTQFTKQHYLIDIVGGILIAEGCYWISMHTKLSHLWMRFFRRVNVVFFGGGTYGK